MWYDTNSQFIFWNCGGDGDFLLLIKFPITKSNKLSSVGCYNLETPAPCLIRQHIIFQPLTSLHFCSCSKTTSRLGSATTRSLNLCSLRCRQRRRGGAGCLGHHVPPIYSIQVRNEPAPLFIVPFRPELNFMSVSRSDGWGAAQGHINNDGRRKSMCLLLTGSLNKLAASSTSRPGGGVWLAN